MQLEVDLCRNDQARSETLFSDWRLTVRIRFFYSEFVVPQTWHGPRAERTIQPRQLMPRRLIRPCKALVVLPYKSNKVPLFLPSSAKRRIVPRSEK